MLLRSLRLAVAVAAGLFAASPALALSFDTTGTVPGLGSARTIKYTLDRPGALPDVTNTVYVVAFEATLDGVDGRSFCVDVLHTLAVPGTYHAVVEAIGPDHLEAAQIANRWSHDLGGLASSLGISLADAAAGVQEAIWKSVYDQPAGLGVIAFHRALTAGEQAAFQVASNPLYWNGVGSTQLLRLTDSLGRTRQAQLFTPAVPEPSALLVFGIGSLLVGHTLRKRPARA